jgi:hypothetical protein
MIYSKKPIYKAFPKSKEKDKINWEKRNKKNKALIKKIIVKLKSV